VSAALIGLAGVVIGGAIAAFVQLRSSARNVRGAARLVREELGLSVTYLQSVGESPESQGLGQALASGVWLNERSLLAAELGRKDWHTVNEANRAVDAIRPLARKRLLTLNVRCWIGRSKRSEPPALSLTHSQAPSHRLRKRCAAADAADA